jgi:hypothetical protein
MAVFGAEQIRESKLASRYFDKYMIAINIGAMLATLAIPFDRHQGEKDLFTEYVVAVSILFFAALLFLAGWKCYIHVPPFDSVVVNCFPVIINAFQSWRQYKNNKWPVEDERTTSSSSNLLNASNSLSEDDRSTGIHERPSSFLSYAKAAHHGKFTDRIVNDVQSLRSAIVVFGLLLPYWLVYNQAREMLYHKMT